MLLTTLAYINGQVVDAESVVRQPPVVTTLPPTSTLPRALLVTVVSVEDAAFHLAYAALVAYVLQLDPGGQPVAVDLLHPLDTLAPSEQVPLRESLVRASWPAWARAPQHVRALLGHPEPPLLLAEAARQHGLPLATLAHAALRDRLPTIRVGDRHLIYLQTVIEAQDRALLHLHRGRPRRHRRS